MTDDAKDNSLSPTGSLTPSNSSSNDPSSLKGLTMALGMAPAEPGHDPLLGCDIGGVTVIRLIAEGGMGRVYEGRQEKPKRTVAVKVMRPGFAAPSLLKRFEYEAEVLGRLEHPGIARIYSVGVYQIGKAQVPYFVMEYIPNAKPLTEYANDLKLPTRQRLDLFRSVCDAVAHGHQKGVIHRDLKPSNILVDATGQPKVIDFGVARATDSDMALTTMQTDIGQLIGTLQYMSPEQFKADTNDIDVRSDVYALGVILYQLLADNMPYDLTKKAVHEVARIVQEDAPRPLSSFNRTLKGDVAVIAGKCLEKERDHRYSSAGEVGADIGRYLSGDAIAASPPTLLDSLGRLARKHRIAASAVAGVFAAMVLAILGITSFYVQAGRERDWAEKQRRKAQSKEAEAIEQRQDSEKVLTFLGKAFQLPAAEPGGHDLTVRELLPMIRMELDKEFGEWPTPDNVLVKASILAALGTSLLGLDSPFDAKACLTDSLSLLESVTTKDTAKKALCMNELGIALQATGDYLEAREILQSALSMKERTLGPSHIETILGRMNLAILLSALGANEEAARLLERSRYQFETNLGPSDPIVAATLESLGRVRYRQGHYTEAESLLTAASAIRRKAFGSDHAVHSSCLNALGDVCRSTGRYQEATALHLEARTLDEHYLGKSHPEAASTLSKLGELHRVQGELSLAKPLLEEALAIREQAGLANHPETAVILHRLALLDAAQGDPKAAEAMFLRAIELRNTRLGHSHRDSIATATDLALFYRESGNTDAADAIERRLVLTTINGL